MTTFQQDTADTLYSVEQKAHQIVSSVIGDIKFITRVTKLATINRGELKDYVKQFGTDVYFITSSRLNEQTSFLLALPYIPRVEEILAHANTFTPLYKKLKSDKSWLEEDWECVIDIALHMCHNDIKEFIDDLNFKNKLIPQQVPTAKNTPDFSHMRSFNPTGYVNMRALYSFLIDERVIKNISESLFTDCITHGNINELWRDCVKSKMKCVLHHIKNHYEKEWFCSIYESVGLNQSQMGKFNLGNKRMDFEIKIIDLITKPQKRPQ